MSPDLDCNRNVWMKSAGSTPPLAYLLYNESNMNIKEHLSTKIRHLN